ncbi:MAG: DUF4286 family protein [Cytophagales bacterium]|nr:DUF4286 family protein [Cytophagales bacterium]
MFIYNISFTVAPAFLEEWEIWSKEYLAPKIMETKCFLSYKTLKVLTKEANQYPTYCLQFTAEGISNYTEFDSKFSSNIKQEVTDKYKDQILYFDSVLKELD